MTKVSIPSSNPSHHQEHTAQPIQLGLVQFLPSPIITFQLLRVELPLGQESDLPLPLSAVIFFHSIPAPGILQLQSDRNLIPQLRDVQYVADSPPSGAPEIPSSRKNHLARAFPGRVCGGRAGGGGIAVAAGGGRGPR